MALSETQVRRIHDQWKQVRDEVATAAERAGRDPGDITIVGVTKYVPVEAAVALFEAGCQHLGESRPQQLWERSERLSALPIVWHMIGPLQRNKVARTIRHTQILHSIDSDRLLSAVSDAAVDQGIQVDVFLEVKLAQEATKHGFAPDEVAGAVNEALTLPGIRVQGLMTIASHTDDLHQARQEFIRLRELRDAIVSAGTGVSLPHLSMGMSDDFREAIAEGATMVRIGSHLWEGLEFP